MHCRRNEFNALCGGHCAKSVVRANQALRIEREVSLRGYYPNTNLRIPLSFTVIGLLKFRQLGRRYAECAQYVVRWIPCHVFAQGCFACISPHTFDARRQHMARKSHFENVPTTALTRVKSYGSVNKDVKRCVTYAQTRRLHKTVNTDLIYDTFQSSTIIQCCRNLKTPPT